LSYRQALGLLAEPKAETATEQSTEMPIAWFVDAGLLNDDHAAELFKIRGVIGNDPVTEFNENADKLVASEHAPAALVQLRPEGQVILFDLGDPLVDAVNEFFRYVRRCGWRIPAWERIAFWWACFATRSRMRAGDLARAIDNWGERFACAVVYLETNKEPAGGGALHRWWWACWHDLRHAGVLDRVRNPVTSEDDDRILNAYGVLFRVNAFVYPSEVQNLLRRHREEDDSLTNEEKQHAEWFTESPEYYRPF